MISPTGLRTAICWHFQFLDLLPAGERDQAELADLLGPTSPCCLRAHVQVVHLQVPIGTGLCRRASTGICVNLYETQVGEECAAVLPRKNI